MASKESEEKQAAPKPKIRETLDIDIRPRGQPKPSYTWVWVTGIILLLALAIFLIVPAIKGYQVYQAMQASGVPENYSTNMAQLIKDKTAAEQQSAADKAALEKSSTELAAMKESLTSCKNDVSTCNQNTQTQQQKAQDLIDSLSKDVETAKSGQASSITTITDAGRRICCAQRVENPTINSYSIVNDKIVCVQDGGTALTC